MKYLFFIITLSCLATSVQAQQIRDYSGISLERDEDYNDAVNAAALETANYILSVPPNNDDMMLVKARQYLIMWMTGSPDYTFSVGTSFVQVSETSKELGAVYLAAMVKCHMDNEEQKDKEQEMTLCAVKRVIAYTANVNNKIKPKKNLKKMIAANKNGELEVYIKQLETISE